MMTKMKIALLSPDAKEPTYASEKASGLDLYSPVDVVVAPGGTRRIEIGVAFELPDGCEGQIRPRSGMAARSTVLAVFGTIDQDFIGGVSVLLINHGPFPYTVRKRDRIAQMVVAPVIRCTLEVVSELRNTQRGCGGHGSTGR